MFNQLFSAYVVRHQMIYSASFEFFMITPNKINIISYRSNTVILMLFWHQYQSHIQKSFKDISGWTKLTMYKTHDRYDYKSIFLEIDFDVSYRKLSLKGDKSQAIKMAPWILAIELNMDESICSHQPNCFGIESKMECII